MNNWTLSGMTMEYFYGEEGDSSVDVMLRVCEWLGLNNLENNVDEINIKSYFDENNVHHWVATVTYC